MKWIKNCLKIKIKSVKNWLTIQMKWIKNCLKIKIKWVTNENKDEIH